MEVMFADVRLANHMALHIKTCKMGEEEAKADFARHNQEVLAHVNPGQVCLRVEQACNSSKPKRTTICVTTSGLLT